MKYQILDINEQEIASKYHLSPLVAKVLTKANLNDSQIQELLTHCDTLTKSNAKCVKEACKRILQAKDNHEKVFIGGDYDTDGICSTAIMKDVLDKLHIENGYYIPDRFKEGYGLSSHTVELAHAKGYSLIITVDNGVKAFDAIQKAKELGIDIIVTDHHQIDEEVPADIVVHPLYMEERFKYLSGAGVALELALNLIGENETHIALAAIALIGDVMPYWLETRIIIQKGIKLIQKGVLPSVSSLLRKDIEIDETAVAFQVVPKLNSIARIKDNSNVNTLVPFLLSNNLKSISSYSAALNKVNESRKRQSTLMVQKAEEMIDDSPILVLYDDSFEEGIAGLVAGRIANSHAKPCVILTKSEDSIKGSGRSIPGFNMFEFFKDFEELTQFGGHEMAVGLCIQNENLEDFKNKIISKYIALHLEPKEAKQDTILVNPLNISVEAIEDLNHLKPVPKEIGKLEFALKQPEIVKKINYEKVTKYTFLNHVDGVLFKYQKIEEVEEPSFVVGTFNINSFRGIKTPQILIDSLEID